MEDLRGKGGGRLKHRTIDGDVPLCLEQNEALCHEQNGERKQR